MGKLFEDSEMHLDQEVLFEYEGEAYCWQGHYISATYTLQVVRQNDPQAQGSAISYARRYAITSILNLSISDDDAEAATRLVRQQQAPKQAVKVAPTEEQFAYIVRYLNGTDAQRKQALEAMQKYNFNKDQNEILNGLV
jgi:hypothetical protein